MPFGLVLLLPLSGGEGWDGVWGLLAHGRITSRSQHRDSAKEEVIEKDFSPPIADAGFT